MKNYKSLVTSSLIAAIIIVSPIAAFAEGNNKEKNNNGNKKAKVEQVEQNNQDKKSKSNSFFRGFSNWFNNRINTNSPAINVNLKPSIEGITAPTVLKTGETGTWAIKASDPKNSSLSYSVDWGDRNIVSKTLSLLSTQAFVQTGTFTHSYSNKGEYKVIFTVSNEAGLKTVSGVTVHVTEAKNVTAPILNNINITDVKSNKATLNWTTDIKSNTMIWISKTSPVDATLNKYNSRRALVLNHKIEARNLEANTKYYVVVGSMNNAGTTKSSETSFTTLPAVIDNNIPVITSITGKNTITLGETATVTINAYNNKNEALTYSADWGDTNIISRNAIAVGAEPVFVQSTTLSHDYSATGVYNAIFTVQNINGEKTTATMKITVNPVVTDTTAPVISSVVSTINGTNVNIKWTTDEPATSSIFYTTTTPVVATESGTLSITDSSLVKTHSVNIPSLTSSTLYHFIIKSLDSSNNVALSSESAFTTN